MELTNPFSFTKQCKILKIPAKDKYKTYKFGHLLYDIENDPNQLTPLDNPIIEKEMIGLLIKLMKESDSPKEQFTRLGLESYL